MSVIYIINLNKYYCCIVFLLLLFKAVKADNMMMIIHHQSECFLTMNLIKEVQTKIKYKQPKKNNLIMEIQQFYYDNKIVKKFLYATIVFGVVGMLVGLIVAFCFYFPT